MYATEKYVKGEFVVGSSSLVYFRQVSIVNK